MTLKGIFARSAAALSVVGFGMAAGAGAAADDGRQTIIVLGEQPSYRADAISSATRTDTALQNVPQSISVVTRDLIEDQSMRSLADVVRYTPGVTMGQGEGHRDAPTLRGQSTTADFFVNGVRDDVQYYRDLYNVERVEVLKGANALVFGRGGSGGVINRVTKEADAVTRLNGAVTLGSFDQRRLELDLGAAMSGSMNLRVPAFYEYSESYRDFVNVERYGVNPVASYRLTPQTRLGASLEYFKDDRTVDRGVPSRNGRPLDIDESTFFGNPLASFSDAEVGVATFTFNHDFSESLRLRSHLVFGAYDKFYANVHPRTAVNAAGEVGLQNYFSSTQRQNAFSQTDLTWTTTTGPIGHTFVLGVELGRQETENFRTQDNNAAGTVTLDDPVRFDPPVFLGARDDNDVTADVAAVFLQDQIALTDQVDLIAGLRVERFDLSVDDRAASRTLSRDDTLVSPRLGLVYRPIDPLSFYASYSVSHLPQSGDQFAGLSPTTASLEPEEFDNLELGAKWTLGELALSAAIYRLDRTNAQAVDPADTSRRILTGEQRSEGVELEIAGAITDRWSIAGGYAYQDVKIASTTTAAPAGRVVPLTPEHAASLWTRVEATPRLGLGLGAIHQGESFASISNSVTLPSFTRFDAALFWIISERLEAQLNIENVFDETYWATAHNDNNITPGSPTAARVTLRGRF